MADQKRLIDANACLKDLCDTCKSLYGGKCQAEPPYECTIRETLSKQPTVEAEEVVQGRWRDMFFGQYFMCSECEFLTDWRLSNYCPNCGAKMDGKAEGKP